MDSTDEPLRRLIYSVIELCDRTRDLACSELRGPFALEPLRHAIDGLLKAVDGVEQSDLDSFDGLIDELGDAESWLGEGGHGG